MNDSKLASQQAFNRQAPTYDQDRNGNHARQQYAPVLDRIKALQFSNLLDVGCGTGELLKQLTADYTSVQFTGVDLSEKMLGVAQIKLKDTAKLVLGDAENLLFDDNSFDLVICNDSFHHYPHPQKAIFEFWRILKKGGILLISDYWTPFPIRQIMNFFLPYSNNGDVKIYSQREIVSFLNSAHFEKIDYSRVNNSAYIVTAQKISYEGCNT